MGEIIREEANEEFQEKIKQKYPGIHEKFYLKIAGKKERRFSLDLDKAQAELKSDIAKTLSRVESWSKEKFTAVDEIELLKENLLSLKDEIEQIIKFFNQEHQGRLKNLPRLHKIIDEIRQRIFKLYFKNVDKQFKELSNLIKTLIAEIEFE